MKKITLNFLFVLLSYSLDLTAQNNREAAELLSRYYTLSICDTSINSVLTFFYFFPNNFNDFCSVYGYETCPDTFLSSPLYDESLDHICLFCNLCGIVSPEAFYKKIIDIVKNGYWQADAVNYLRSCLTSHLLSEVDTPFLYPQTYHSTMTFLSVLDSYPTKEQLSFWEFFFDSRYIGTDDFKNIYNRIKKSTKSRRKLYGLMKKGYESADQHTD